MGKRSTGRKRGIQRGIVKHTIRSKRLQQGKSEGERRVFGIAESVYFSVGRKCFDFWFFCSEKLYLVPFTRTLTGQYVPLDPKRQLIHYFVWLLQSLMLLHKVWGLGIILMYEELKIETFMSISQFLVCFVPFCISLGTIVRPKETMDLLNSWPFILSCLKDFGKGVSSPFDEVPLALKLITVLLTVNGIAAVASLLSLAFSTLPTCYFPTVERWGLIPEGLLSPFTWQLIFFPLEYATYLPPMLIAPLSGCIMIILMTVYRIYIRELR